MLSVTPISRLSMQAAVSKVHFFHLQDSSSAEKEQLQKEASEARAAVEQHLKSLEQAQAAATADAKTLDDKIAALTAELEAAKVRSNVLKHISNQPACTTLLLFTFCCNITFDCCCTETFDSCCWLMSLNACFRRATKRRRRASSRRQTQRRQRRWKSFGARASGGCPTPWPSSRARTTS